MSSVFDLTHQQDDLSSRIVVGLERISEAFRVLLWEHAKVIGLSPIQIQILIFIAHHQENLCNVSHLAREFNMTKPTISDAVKALLKKEMIGKTQSSGDKRAYSIHLSQKGKNVVKVTENFAAPIKGYFEGIDDDQKKQMLKSLSNLIYQLNQTGVLTVQRTCFKCVYFEQHKSENYCRLMEKPLPDQAIRLDCPEFEDREETK